MGEKMVLGEQKGPWEDSMGSLTAWDRVCLVRCWLPVSSPILRVHLPCWRHSQEEIDYLVPFGGSDLRQMREIRVSPASAVFQCLQLKVICVPKQQILGWHILESFSHILGATYSASLYYRMTSWKIQNCRDSKWTRGLGGGKDEEVEPRGLSRQWNLL